MNTVTISGNLTKDPELREIGDDLVVCDFSIAWNQSKKQGDEWIEVAHFFDCSLFRGRGEMLARKAKKGDKVYVTGRLNFSSWENDGERRTKVTIAADDADGEWRYRPASEDSTPAAASPATESKKAGKSKAKSADDDIPF